MQIVQFLSRCFDVLYAFFPKKTPNVRKSRLPPLTFIRNHAPCVGRICKGCRLGLDSLFCVYLSCVNRTCVNRPCVNQTCVYRPCFREGDIVSFARPAPRAINVAHFYDFVHWPIAAGWIPDFLAKIVCIGNCRNAPGCGFAACRAGWERSILATVGKVRSGDVAQSVQNGQCRTVRGAL